MLDFQFNGCENLLKQAFSDGISLFCGAGFSVEAYNLAGEKLMLGADMLERMKKDFPSLSCYTQLPRACTKLIATQKEEFYSQLKKWFTVGNFDERYLSLMKIKLRNIYTTNIDDLFFRIFQSSSDDSYLIDRSVTGAPYNDEAAINYFPLHGCIRNENQKYVFGATEIAAAFSQRGSEQSWKSLAEDAADHAILFWGWNFEDTGPLAAIYADEDRTTKNIRRWILIRDSSEEKIDFLQSLDFNIIIGDTALMLDYISNFSCVSAGKPEIFHETIDLTTHPVLRKYSIPANDANLPSYPLQKFFSEYSPRWSYMYSGAIPKTSHYKSIAENIASGMDTVVMGMRGSGKTTLCMQLAVECHSLVPKQFMVAPSEEEVRMYVRLLRGRKVILFVDDCFRDTNAVIALLETSNIQAVFFDRDFNYERQFHKIKRYEGTHFKTFDITEIKPTDAQSIINIIPEQMKRLGASTRNFDKDPTILNLLAMNLKAINFNFMLDFCHKDLDAARVFMMIAYVHSCGTPCSFDMIYYFLGSNNYSWKKMNEIVKRAGRLIKDATYWMHHYDLKNAVQDYYQCRSRFLAEKIMNSIPVGNKVFAEVLCDFVDYVPPHVICLYDKFRRSYCDADLIARAFPEVKDGEKFYERCKQRDDSEYVYQQAALYFLKLKDYKKAFLWIDNAQNLAHYNRFSIDITYARIYFEVNLESNEQQAIEALEIMGDCCKNDKRREIHFVFFAQCCIRFHRKYNNESSLCFISKALAHVKEGLEGKNSALSWKNKKKLSEIERKLTDLVNS